MLQSRIFAATVTVVLLGIGCGLIAYGWPQRHIYYQSYRFDAAEAQALRFYPPAMRAHGENAWRRLDPKGAAGAFRQALRHDVLDMDAWLRLAHVERARGNPDEARRILAFVADYSGSTSRWQRSILLLAHELGMERLFRRSVNFMLSRGLKQRDTLNLLDTHYGSASRCLKVLEPESYPAYLEWLIRGGRTAEAQLVWKTLSAAERPDDEITLKYIHFLISQKEIRAAQAAWQAHSGATGMTNGGFDRPIDGRGFDWRVGASRERLWQALRVPGQGRNDSTALKVSFDGRANVNFHHLYQIVPVSPGKPHRLRFWWRSLHLTTDQGPFVEVYGYDCRGFHRKGPMFAGSSHWQKEQIDFTPPPDCNAVTVRLRRKTSQRFDNKIKGSLWLDDFRLETLPLVAGMD